MHRLLKPLLTALFAVSILAACSSTPTWEGMSQTDIAGWKDLGLNAEMAQKYVKNGFDLATATPWVNANIDPKTAAEWTRFKFSAEEAVAWIGGGFDLEAARDNRAKGLNPVQ